MSEISKETREIDGLTFTITKIYDESPDLSWLGEYQARNEDFIVDREKGILWGKTEGEPPDEYDFDTENGSYDVDAYEKAEEKWLATGVWAEDLHTRNRREYRYFKPYAGGIDPLENKEEWIKCALQDYDRYEAYNRGDWCMMGVVVSLDLPDCPTCGPRTVSDSLWGIESDSDEEYIEDLIAECMAQAKP